MAKIICGVDVSGAWLDARIDPGGPALRTARTPEGIAELGGFCAAHGVDLVAMEATGGYERLPYSLLWEQGLACAILNPRQARRFAEAMGFLEKTDDIDAGMIAAFARAKGIVGQPPSSASQQTLKALVTRLRQLTELKVAQTNQARLIEDATCRASFETVLAVIRQETRVFERKIADLLGSDPLWCALDEAFREIKGVADRTVARLMAEMPEIGTLSSKAIAKLAGLAPMASDSGKRAGKRSVRGGRRNVRAILYVVADLVRRHEPDFAAFHARLLKAGKSRKCARIALARKLLVRLNAKARDVRNAMAA
ncbi:MAG: IS110 family transposase [candidate division NC10 bacterium]